MTVPAPPDTTPTVPDDLRRTTRWTAAGALAAGALLLLFPVLRPWPDESVPSLALVAAAGVLVAAALRRTGARWAGIVVAAGLVLYLPQFFGTPAIRVGHGVLVALGLLLVAWGVSRVAPGTTTAGHPEG